MTTPSIPIGPRTPLGNSHIYGTSPENDYFRAPPRTRHASRWKEDWEELELLVIQYVVCHASRPYFIPQGRGAFGSVVKARNKIDNRIYAGKSRYFLIPS